MQIFNEKLGCYNTSIERWTNKHKFQTTNELKRKRQIAKRLKMSIPWKIGVQYRAICHYQHCVSKGSKVQVLAWVYNTFTLKGDKSEKRYESGFVCLDWQQENNEKATRAGEERRQLKVAIVSKITLIHRCVCLRYIFTSTDPPTQIFQLKKENTAQQIDC